MESALLQVILAQSDEAIHMVNANGITLYYNAMAAAMDGLNAQEVVGKYVLEVFPSLNRDTSTLLKVARTGRPIVDQQQVYTNLRGQKITTINTTLPVYRQGQLQGAVELARDISQVRQLAEQVVDLRRRLNPNQPSPKSSQGAKYTFEDIIGDNLQLRQLLVRGALVAHTDSPVMVTGETGTGKELLVQAIHNESSRSDKPFVPQNCAALPESLLEALLFGTVKGSFTGAQDRPGLFELAHGGTLFLDEINAMPRALQAKLLRVLETGEIRRLGATASRMVDVRIISALAANPQSQLRTDLYYRLNVVLLDLPPLRQRWEDIVPLSQHFLQQHNASLGTQVQGFTAEAMEMLLAWHWPGNVRELSNLVEGVLNFRSTGYIATSDLPEHYVQTPGKGIDLRQHLAQVEKDFIFQAMKMSQGNTSRAAEFLRLPRQTLQRKLQHLEWHKNCT